MYRVEIYNYKENVIKDSFLCRRFVFVKEGFFGFNRFQFLLDDSKVAPVFFEKIIDLKELKNGDSVHIFSVDDDKE